MPWSIKTIGICVLVQPGHPCFSSFPKHLPRALLQIKLWQFQASRAEICVTETQSHEGRVSLQPCDDKWALKADIPSFCQKEKQEHLNEEQSNQRSGWEPPWEEQGCANSEISCKVEEELQRRAWLMPRASWHNWNCRKQSFEGSGFSSF